MKKYIYLFKFELFRKLLFYSGNYAKKLKIALVLLLLSAIFYGLALASLVPIFINVFSKNEVNVFIWLTLFTGSFLCSSILKWVANNFDYKGYMIQIMQNIRTELGKKLRVLPLQKIEEMHSGQTSSTLMSSLDSTLMPFIMVTNLVLMALIVPITVAICLLFFEWKIAVLILMLFPVLLLFYFVLQPKFAKASQKIDSAHANVNSNIIEYVQGLSTLHTLNSVGKKFGFLQEHLSNLKNVQTNNLSGATNASLIMATIVELMVLFILVMGSVFVTTGEMEVSFLVAVFLIIIRLSSPLSTIVIYSAYFESIEVALNNIDSILGEAEMTSLEPLSIPSSYDIVFENVYFKYNNEAHFALNGVTMEFKNGTITAIVGYSGCGKSTVIKMINRFADPEKGKVTIGGVDIKQISTENLSNMISVVFQDVYLFNDSIFNNIKMSCPNASIDEVRKAASLAYCDEFVQGLPNGYETIVGTNGYGLSGGERQRISIARAILKNSPILILDEPTSALDVQSEYWIQKSINQLLTEGKTIILISHHLSVIAGVDKIYVMSEGEVVEEGKHSLLISEEGHYKKLYEYFTTLN